MNGHASGQRGDTEGLRETVVLNPAVEYVMELHVMIRDAHVPAGSATQPTHPVALCVFV